MLNSYVSVGPVALIIIKGTVLSFDKYLNNPQVAMFKKSTRIECLGKFLLIHTYSRTPRRLTLRGVCRPQFCLFRSLLAMNDNINFFQYTVCELFRWLARAGTRTSKFSFSKHSRGLKYQYYFVKIGRKLPFTIKN